MKVSAEVADSPASFQPLNAQTSAGARRPSGRRSQRRAASLIHGTASACSATMDAMSSPELTVAGLRAGDQVDAVFACSRKDRLTARSGTPYLALELRDRTGAIQARAFKDADVLAGRFERGDLVRVAGRVERFRDELQIDVRAIARAEQADPAAFLPVAYRNVDELDGFLEHLAREVHDPGYATFLQHVINDEALRTELAPRALHARRPPRLPRRPARAHGRGRHAGARMRAAAPASESGPAAHRGARARPRQDARVHLRGRDRADRRGPAARPHRARPAAARPLRAAGRPAARALPLHPHPPRRPAGARRAVRQRRGARALPPQRARRLGQGRAWSTGYHRQP